MATDYAPIDFLLLRTWTRDKAQINSVRLTVGVTQVSFLPYNPNRFALILTSNLNASAWWTVGAAPLTNGNVTIPAGSGAIVLTEDDIGDMIGQPVWCIINTGSVPQTATEVCYLPERKAILDRYIARCVSIASTL